MSSPTPYECSPVAEGARNRERTAEFASSTWRWPRLRLRMPINYDSLYTRYSANSIAAQGLDQEVARAALKTGKAPRQVIQLLAQGPVYPAADCGVV